MRKLLKAQAGMNRFGAARLGEAVWASALRFPVSALAAAAFTVVVAEFGELVGAAPVEDLLGGEGKAKLLGCFAIAFFAAGAARLVAEGIRKPFGYLMDGAGFGLILALAVWLWHAPGFPQHFPFVLAASIAAVFIAAMARGSDLALWRFDYQICVRTFLAGFAGLVLLAGFLGTIGAIDILFEADFDGETYARTAALVAAFLTPLFVLAGVPRASETSDAVAAHADYPKALRILFVYIGIPLLGIYGTILYLYAVRLMILGAWPQGGVAEVGLFFLLPGLFLWLATKPLADERDGIAGWFHKLFFPASLVPFGLVAAAIWVRITDYGVTEERLVIVLVLGWTVIAAAGAYLWRRRAVSVLLTGFALLVLLGGVGPFNAYRLSMASQLGELQAVMDEARNLPVTASDEEKSALADRLRSIAYYMNYADKRAALVARYPDFAASEDKPFYQAVDAQIAALGLQPEGAPFGRLAPVERGGLQSPLALSLGGATNAYLATAAGAYNAEAAAPLGLVEHPKARLLLDEGANRLLIAEGFEAVPIAVFDLAPVLEHVRAGDEAGAAPLRLTPAKGPADWRLVIVTLYWGWEGEEVRPFNAQAILLTAAVDPE